MANDGGSMAYKIFRALRTPVTLLFLLAVLGYAANWGYARVIAPIPPPAPVPCSAQPIDKGALQSNQVTIRVLNGGAKRGQATDVASRLREKAFIVSEVGNTDTEVAETVIVVQNKDNPEAKLVIPFFPKAIIKEEPDRVDHVVDVLLGSKYGGFNDKAATSLKVSAASVCLLPKPTS